MDRLKQKFSPCVVHVRSAFTGIVLDETRVRLIRLVQNEEGLESLVNEAKSYTWDDFAEVALVELTTGDRAFVRGGRYAITFDYQDRGQEGTVLLCRDAGVELSIRRLLWHTHPVPCGPSDHDRAILRLLNQTESTVYEINGAGDGTRFGPDKHAPDAG